MKMATIEIAAGESEKDWEWFVGEWPAYEWMGICIFKERLDLVGSLKTSLLLLFYCFQEAEKLTKPVFGAVSVSTFEIVFVNWFALTTLGQ